MEKILFLCAFVFAMISTISLSFAIPFGVALEADGPDSGRIVAGWITAMVAAFAYLGVTKAEIFSLFAWPSGVSLNIYWLGGGAAVGFVILFLARFLEFLLLFRLPGVISFVLTTCGLLIIYGFFTSMRFVNSFTSVCIGLLIGVFIHLTIIGFDEH